MGLAVGHRSVDAPGPGLTLDLEFPRVEPGWSCPTRAPGSPNGPENLRDIQGKVVTMKTRLFISLLGWIVFETAAQDLSDVLPAIKTVPAPDGIRAGVRLSYYGSVADLPNDGISKWDETADSWNYATAPSAHGYTQIDVIGVSGGRAALSVQAWLYSNWTGPLIPVRGGQSGLVCYAGGGDWWVHPQVLGQLQETRTDAFAVVRVTQVLDGIAHPAIRIQRTLPESRQASVYDLQTGLLLFKNAAVLTGDTTFVSQIFYKGSRPLPFSGKGTPLPRWLKSGVQLSYRGTYTARVQGGSPFSLPLQAGIEIQQVDETWFLYRQTTTLSSLEGLPPTVETVTLVGGGTLYIDPDALGGVTPETILDTDPITGATLEVVAQGSSVVLVASAGNQSITEFTYDAAVGLMTRFRSWDSTDPVYSLTSELVLDAMPDLTLPPRLTIRRQGKEVILGCPDAGDFQLEASEDGGRTWAALGTMPGERRFALNTAKSCLLYRLRR